MCIVHLDPHPFQSLDMKVNRPRTYFTPTRWLIYCTINEDYNSAFNALNNLYSLFYHFKKYVSNVF